jgi:hypothetical protein
MYGVFTKLGASAVLCAGLSVLGISSLCSNSTPAHQHATPVTVGVQADADINGDVAAAPGSVKSGAGVDGTITVRVPNPRPTTNPSNPGQPGSNQPGCNCTSTNPSLVTVKPHVDLDVDVDAKLPGAVVDPNLAGGLVGTVGAVVNGVSPDCGCTPSGQPALLSVSVLGH